MPAVTLKDGTGATLAVGSYPDANGNVALGHVPLVAGLPVAPNNPLPSADVGIGTDGSSAPAIAGSGVRGWLRGIYEKLAGTLTVGGTVAVSNLPGTQPVSAATLPLPTGAATAALQSATNAALAGTLATSDAGLGADGASAPAISGTGVRGWLRAIYEKVAGTLTVGGTIAVSNLPATQAISASALPLPTGAATAALQTATNTALAGTLSVAAASLPLPAGAATAALQATAVTALKAFTPAGSTTLAGATTSARVALPSSLTTNRTARLFNSGSVALNVEFGTSTVAATTTTSLILPPGVVEAFGVPDSATHIAAIAGTGAATLYVTVGEGS